jgi:hypothetical protein
MRWIARRVMNVMMEAFVGSGLGIDEAGRLCLPDGLSPTRVWRFVDLLTAERHASPREAMHTLLRRVGVEPRTLALLEKILHEDGDVDLTAVARHAPSLSAALPRLQAVPGHLREFLVHDLALADPASDSFEKAAASTRLAAASRLGCTADWDAILEHPEGVSELARPWRERLA